MPTQSSTCVDVSVIITAHREGRLAHRSVQSAERAAAFARRRGLQVELIAVLDAPDEATRAYFSQRKGAFANVREANLRDLGLARNFGVEIARGRFVCFLDADDLVSENWFEAAYRFAEAHEERPVVLHPELNLFFGNQLALSRHIDATDPNFWSTSLLEFNYWSALCFVPRSFFLDGNQYAPTDLNSQFGYEDWHWNCQTLAQGVFHRIVPETVHFIRVKDRGSLLEETKRARAVIRPTRLFDDDILGRCQFGKAEGHTLQPTPVSKRRRTIDGNVIQGLFGAYRLVHTVNDHCAQSYPRLSRCLLETSKAFRRLITSAPRVPAWLLQEWRKIHAIEPELFPTGRALRELRLLLRPQSVAARRYPDLATCFGPPASHVFLIPREVTGAVQATLAAQLSTVFQPDSSQRAVCLTTAKKADPSLNRALPRAVILPIGRHLSGLLHDEQDLLLVRLLLQKHPQVIHNIGSPIGCRLLRKYALALASQSELRESQVHDSGTCRGRETMTELSREMRKIA